MILFLAAQFSHPLIAAPPPPPPPAQSRGLLSYEDYPAEALRHRWQGTVAVDLTINIEGRVSSCRIIRSSGHQVLDDTTCSIFIRRATFKPARDDQGKPVESTFRPPPITWKLP